MIKFTINMPPISKREHIRMVFDNGKLIMLPNEQYKTYEELCEKYLEDFKDPIMTKVNIKAMFYRPNRRRMVLTDLLETLLDILVKYRVIYSSNSRYVVSFDGSGVFYDTENPRTEVEITEIENGGKYEFCMHDGETYQRS